MNGRKAEKRLAILEIILSLAVIAGAGLLVVSWEKYEWAFAVVFACSAVLLFVRGIMVFLKRNPRAVPLCIISLLGAAAMTALATATILTIIEI